MYFFVQNIMYPALESNHLYEGTHYTGNIGRYCFSDQQGAAADKTAEILGSLLSLCATNDTEIMARKAQGTLFVVSWL